MRFPFAFLLVGLLGLLAAGGAVLGAFQAPTGTSLAVHNGAGETLLAGTVVGSYTSSSSSGTTVSFDLTPDRVKEVAVGPTGKVEGKRTVTGSQAIGILSPVRGLLRISTFAPNGTGYRSKEPASILVPASERSAVTGTYDTTVQLSAGYVVTIVEHLDASDHGQRIDEEIDYRLSRVDSWTRGRS